MQNIGEKCRKEKKARDQGQSPSNKWGLVEELESEKETEKKRERWGKPISKHVKLMALRPYAVFK